MNDLIPSQSNSSVRSFRPNVVGILLVVVALVGLISICGTLGSAAIGGGSGGPKNPTTDNSVSIDAAPGANVIHGDGNSITEINNSFCVFSCGNGK